MGLAGEHGTMSGRGTYLAICSGAWLSNMDGGINSASTSRGLARGYRVLAA